MLEARQVVNNEKLEATALTKSAIVLCPQANASYSFNNVLQADDSKPGEVSESISQRESFFGNVLVDWIVGN